MTATDCKKVLDHIYDMIYVTDDSGNVLYVNDACERNYGIGADRVIGRDSRDLAQKGYFKPITGPIVRKHKKVVTIEEKTSTGKSLVSTAVPIFDDHGALELVVWTCRDMNTLGKVKHDFRETNILLAKMAEEIKELRSRELKIPGYVAVSDRMQELITYVHKLGRVDSNILIRGESGTGKNLLAKYIHKVNRGSALPFITINCSAIPEALFESELFGYVKGSFTGADTKDKIGLLDLANGGTLFLDEIAEIPVLLQAKLLSVIQEHQFSPVGGRKKKQINCRIIAATNRDLDEMVQSGQFRKDLLYRLNVVELEVPPLRSRRADIVPLLYQYIEQYDKKYNTFHELSDAGIRLLTGYDWPGNVRELEHVAERLVIGVEEKLIQAEHVHNSIKNINAVHSPAGNPEKEAAGVSDLNQAVDQFKAGIIVEAYRKTGSTYGVSRALNISQSTAFRLVRKYCGAPPG